LCNFSLAFYFPIYHVILLLSLGAISAGLGYALKPKETRVEISEVGTAQPQEATSKAPLSEATPTVKAEPSIELVEVKGIGPKRSEQLKNLGILTLDKGSEKAFK